ncbi:MAG: S1 RNA-binding domain-containing protein, partial [Pseudomonadota bacterium]
SVRLEEMAEHISTTERTSAEAERNSVDRFTAAFLKDKIGLEFVGRISGVTRFGLFVKLDQTGADGLVPIRSLPSDYYVHDEAQHALIGKRTGRVFRLGATVLTRVMEADTITGSTVFELVNGEAGAEVAGYVSKNTPSGDFSRRRPQDRNGDRKKSFGGKDRGNDGKKRSQKPKSGPKNKPKNDGPKGKNPPRRDDR